MINSNKDISPELTTYFNHIFDEYDPTIKLDQDQIDVILDDSNFSLIIAGAGTGKTTTMVAKVKYLVDIQKVDPRKILVLSYARKNVVELRNKINEALNIPADISTFHSLGYKYIRSIFQDLKCSVIDDNRRRDIFTKFFKTEVYPDNIADFIEVFNTDYIKGYRWFYGNFFKENYQNFISFDEYFKAYKNKKLSEINDLKQALNELINERTYCEHPKTIRGEFVKSSGEAIIANFFTRNGIDYQYEKIYEEVLPDNATYRPDFTLQIGGQTIYVEYFGIKDKSTPYTIAYAKNRAKKEQYHREHGNKFISLEYDPDNNYLKILETELKNYGFKFNPRSDRELYEILLDSNPLAELFNLETFFFKVIDSVKSSPDRDNYSDIITKELNNFNNTFNENLTPEQSKKIAINQWKWFLKFFKFYQNELHPSKQFHEFDYADLIYFAHKYIKELDKNSFNYDYVLIDEYQDISLERYHLLKETIERTKAKLTAIGDDWQSIYAFSGSRIEYMYNFKKYFPEAKQLSIRKTFRNTQSLINTAGEFIMRNENQIKKTLISSKTNIQRPILFLFFDSEKNTPQENGEIEILHESILRVHKNFPDDTILVLGRRNSDINKLFNYKTINQDDTESFLFKNDLDTKIQVINTADKNFLIDAMTIHKSKGLTYDWVFITGLDKNFPLKDRNDFWLIQLFKNKKIDEQIEDAEERRVFYVALTRCTKKVILLTNHNSSKRSKFIDELSQIIKDEEIETYR